MVLSADGCTRTWRCSEPTVMANAEQASTRNRHVDHRVSLNVKQRPETADIASFDSLGLFLVRRKKANL